MSTIRNAFSSVKNFVSNIINKQQEESGSNEEGYQQEHSSRFARALFGRGDSRKRSAPSNVYEPEITDDEDDTPGLSYFRSSCQSSKRLRVESGLELEMASQRDSQQSRYTTRATGAPPNIEAGTSRTSSIAEKNVGAMENMHISPPTSSDKDIEVITLEDDDPRPSTSKDFYVQKQSTATSPQERNQLAMFKSRVARPMKASKPRDCNRLSKYMGEIGRKFISPVIRLKEKHQYKQLLMAHNVLNSSGMYQPSALTKSKVGAQQLQVLYHTFGTSPTKGTVSFRVNGKRLSEQCRDLVSSDDRKALVPMPRLYSTPQEPERYDDARGRKAITYEKEPEIIDLEEEPSSSNKIVPCVSPITPIASRRSYTSPTSLNTSLIGNYACLEDALNSSSLPDESAVKDDLPETSQLALEDSSKDEDEDLSIIAERVVTKSRNKSVNTLALEQTLCPYVEKRWLEESKSSWRENQKYREKRIQEEAQTLSILARESTIEKDIEERIRKKLTLTEIIVLEEPPEELPELDDEMLGIIRHARARGNDNEVLAQVRLSKDTISITRGDVRTLGPSQWLNDNVINTYMGLIVLRSKIGKYPSVYAFQTFFYPKLMKEGYSNSLKRWTRKDDIFAHDLIILPIHLGLHWCLACVDLRKKTIRYYDSLGGDNNKCLQLLLEYLTREMKERRQTDLDKSEWTLENVKGIPQQQNGSDCGMFSCKFAEYLSRDSSFTFKQEDMPYYRDRMIYELIRSNLLHP